MALSAAELTRRQELGSAWILRRALKDNIRYSKWEDIVKDPKFDELGGSKGIYPEVDSEWIKTFFLQQKKMLEEFSNPQFTEFNREYGFMKYISDLVKDKFGISKKDSWDPADIWCIRNEKKVISEINELLRENRLDSLNDLNAVLRTYFNDRIIVGISLKKISGSQAMYEEVNVKGSSFPSVKDLNYKVTYLKCNLDLKRSGKGDYSFATQDTRVDVEAYENDKKIIYKTQIKGTSTSDFSNLKWEPTSTAATSARLGKAPVDMVAKLMKEYGVNFVNSNSKYPKDSSEFTKKKDYYMKMFASLKNKIELDITSQKEFYDNFKLMFLLDPVTANSKLMQLEFLNEVVKLSKDELNNFFTEVIFLAQKKGEQFGPFGKLY